MGESQLAKHRKKIKHVSVHTYDENRKPIASREVVEAIMEADMVVIGPGSLYTSILPNLMIEDIGQAVCETKSRSLCIFVIL